MRTKRTVHDAGTLATNAKPPRHLGCGQVEQTGGGTVGMFLGTLVAKASQTTENKSNKS
jgi:hypothetical protein